MNSSARDPHRVSILQRICLRIGVVNQTTMLATETQAIADHLKQVMVKKYGEADVKSHFADTRDTLCYATNDNQDATNELLKTDADLALVVGGYNSSNTSHLVETARTQVPHLLHQGRERDPLSAESDPALQLPGARTGNECRLAASETAANDHPY